MKMCKTRTHPLPLWGSPLSIFIERGGLELATVGVSPKQQQRG